MVDPVYGRRFVKEPTKAWYYRDFRDPNMEGPVDFITADREARKLSRESAQGVAEVVTYENSQLIVVATYLRGRKRYGGKRARDASRLNLPPTL